jgi:hypothetical protein
MTFNDDLLKVIELYVLNGTYFITYDTKYTRLVA